MTSWPAEASVSLTPLRDQALQPPLSFLLSVVALLISVFYPHTHTPTLTLKEYYSTA